MKKETENRLIYNIIILKYLAYWYIPVLIINLIMLIIGIYNLNIFLVFLSLILFIIYHFITMKYLNKDRRYQILKELGKLYKEVDVCIKNNDNEWKINIRKKAKELSKEFDKINS